MSEFKIDVPIIDEAAGVLKSKGIYSKAMSQGELSDVMKGVVDSLLSSREDVQISVPLMSVKIKNKQGHVSASVEVESPINATIDLECVLGNSSKIGKLELVDLTVTEHAGFFEQLALSTIGVEGKAREALENPNKALLKELKKQLKKKEAKLESLSLSFNDDGRLGIVMKGKPLK